MRIFRRFWAPLLAAGLIPFLLVLAALQISWIQEVGVRERVKLFQGLVATADQLAEALQEELLGIPAAFSWTPQETQKPSQIGEWPNFEQCLEFWKIHATVPEIISSFVIFSEAPDTENLSRWNGSSFSPFYNPELRQSLLRVVATREDLGAPGREPVPLEGGGQAFILSGAPGGRKWLAILLDDRTLNNRLIPDLAAKYLVERNEFLFRILAEPSGKTVYSSEAEAQPTAFERPDLVLMISASGYRAGPYASASDPADHLRKAPKNLLQARIGDYPYQGLLRWRLEAVHRSGSLETAEKSSVRRSSAISIGILAIISTVILILAVAARKTQALAARQQEFIASVTHELKSPLAVIRSAAENLADGVVTDRDQILRYGSVIRRESGRLGRMVDSLLAYARVGDSGSRNLTTFNLSQTVLRVMETYATELKREGFKVELQVKPDLRIVGEQQAIELVVGNLVTNAIKHASAGAFLAVSLDFEVSKGGSLRSKEPTPWAVLTLRDAGPGISRKEQKLVFEPFYRGTVARSLQRPGSGIGLNLVRRIILAHGGTITLGTGVEGGATFIIKLPLEECLNGEGRTDTPG